MNTPKTGSLDLENLNMKVADPANPESGDDLLEKINQIKDETGMAKFRRRLREFRVTIAATAIVGTIAAFNSDEIEDIWRWIKLQAQEMAATGPTLSTDPIGVFSRSVIGYTESLGSIDQSALIPLRFTSITRFRLDAVRYKAEFIVDKNARTLNDCLLVIEGALDSAEGGIAEGSYLSIVQCPSHAAKMLDSFSLVAFPPEVNTLLAPANYYLIETTGE